MEVLSENRRAKFDYETLGKYTAGIELTGQEVKSARNGNFNIAGSYALVRNGEVWLINSQIPPYQRKNSPNNYDPQRSRRLLLEKNEIKHLVGQLNQKSSALVPFSVFLKNNLIKIELILGRRRKKHDKREYLKTKVARREMQTEK